MLPALRGLAVLDNDGRNRVSSNRGEFETLYWSRYEAENYFITPDLLQRYAKAKLESFELFSGFRAEIKAVLDQLIQERVFANEETAFRTYSTAESAAASLIWTTSTARIKLSDFAEEFYRRLHHAIGIPMLLRKGELHLLIPHVEPSELPREVHEKLDSLHRLLTSA